MTRGGLGEGRDRAGEHGWRGGGRSGCAAMLAAVLWATISFSGTALADPVWVQIEARPTRAAAEARAQDWGRAFPEVQGFRLPSGWYALALGPFDTADAAQARLRALRDAGAIPRDSYVADARHYRNQFWPAAAAPVAAPDAMRPDAEPLAVDRAALTAGVAPARPAFSRAGAFITAGGATLTAARGLDACRAVTIEGEKARIAFRDAASGLAVLTPETPLAPPSVAAC